MPGLTKHTKEIAEHAEMGTTYTPSCVCDECMGACNSGEGGKCGECFACEELADNERFWEANSDDILGR